MTNLQEKLFELSEAEYAAFISKLNPTVNPESIIGVRVPMLRKLAKEFAKSTECRDFLDTLPHDYYEENLLHSFIIAGKKDYNTGLTRVEAFLPYVDNWAVCDTLMPRVFSKHKTELFNEIKNWISSDSTYICRFGINMLMTHYLDDAFDASYLELPASVNSEEYYVKMMIAWFYATALAKQWDDAVIYLQQNRLSDWVHAKTIQKACESNRITPSQKAYLKTLKRKSK